MTLTTEPGAAVDAREQTSEPTSAPSSQRLVIGRYHLIEPLGRGGMGRVYRAHDDLLDRPVAVKLIYDDAVSDRDLRRACAVEARAAARLSHPGIVRILDSGFDDGHCFVVMELAEGQTLTQIVRESGRLPVERALGLAAQVADALEEAHRQGVVHCDVKPSNLIVDRNGRVRLVDFGIARVSNSSSGLSDQDIHGSAKYVAPEQVEGAAIDGRTDLYSLGVVLFEMLTGRPPFSGGNLASILAQRLIADPPSVRGLQPTVPLDVDLIVRRAMAREPDHRYQSAGELRDALRSAREILADTDRLPLREVMPVARRHADRPVTLGLWTTALGRGVASAGPRTTSIVRDVLPWLARSLRLVSEWLAQSGRVLGDRVAPALAGTARPRQLRWPSLRVAVGTVALLGLVTGIAAAQCGMVAGTAEETLVVQPAEASAENIAAPAPPEPTTAPTEAPTAAPAVAPTEPPPPPAPTATDPPPPATATALRPEPPTAAAPAQRAPAPAPKPAPNDGQNGNGRGNGNSGNGDGNGGNGNGNSKKR